MLTKVRLIKATIFLVVMYGWESWTIKKAECRRIDAFELWCWRRLLRVLWTARKSNQSILHDINPEYYLEGLMLKLKLQYFGHLMWTADSLEKTLMLGKIKDRGEGDNRAWEDEMVERQHWLNGPECEQTQERAKERKPGMLQFMESQRLRQDWPTEQQQHKQGFFPVMACRQRF